MASKVEMLITAKDEASSKISKLSSAFKELTGFSLGSVTALGAVGGAMAAMINFTRDSIQATVEYADQVRDLSRLTGMQAEETSRMIQVADDLDLSYQSLTASLKYAVRQGIDPTIENLARMSDEYLNLEPGLERSSYLMQNFGRNGAEMAKILEKGGAALRQMSENMDENMILTEAAVYQSREFQIAMDNASDVIEGISYRIGTRAIPALTNLANAFTDAVAGADALWEADKRLLEEGIMPQISSGQKLADMLAEMQYDQIASSISAYEQALQNAASATGLAYTSNENYIQSLYGIQPASEDAQSAQEQLRDELNLIKSSFSELTAEMIYNKAAADLDADAALYLAREMGLLNENSYQTLLTLQGLREKYDINGDGAITAAEGAMQYANEVLHLGEVAQTQTIPTLAELGESLLMMGGDADMAARSIGSVNNAIDHAHSKTITFTVNFKARGDTWIAGFSAGGHAGGYVGQTEEYVNENFASGVQNFVVPPGYPNDSFIVGLTSGERVDVTPAGAGTTKAGGDVIIQINGPVYGGNIERMMQDAAKRAFREMESKYA